MTESQQKNRQIALDIAARTFGHHIAPKVMMEAAEIMYQFLEGSPQSFPGAPNAAKAA